MKIVWELTGYRKTNFHFGPYFTIGHNLASNDRKMSITGEA